jgi:hypothetical protein
MAKIRKLKAFHEAGHAVVARALGITVPLVSMKSTAANNGGSVLVESASWQNRNADTPTRIRAAEANAMVALAGGIAQERSHPRYRVQDEVEGDLSNARNYVFIAAMHAAGIPVPEGERVAVEVPPAVAADANSRLGCLVEATARLLSDKWASVERVAKTLERHDHIDQVELDRLIAIGERRA